MTTGTVASARLARAAVAAARAAPIRAGRPAALRSRGFSTIGAPIWRSGSNPSCGPTCCWRRSAAASRWCWSMAGCRPARSARWRRCAGAGRGRCCGASRCAWRRTRSQAERFRPLGARAVASVGDLKAAAAPLAGRPAALARTAASGSAARPLWLAASTHPGEEEIVAAAHRRIVAARIPGLLTIIAPRHPVRGDGDRRDAARRGPARRAPRAPASRSPATPISISPTRWASSGCSYRLAGIAFIGGSLVAQRRPQPVRGGAARLRRPARAGHDELRRDGRRAGRCGAARARPLPTPTSLARAVSRLLADPAAARTRAPRRRAQVAAAGSGALDAVLERLAPWLDALAPAKPSSMLPSEPPRAALQRVSDADARS